MSEAQQLITAGEVEAVAAEKRSLIAKMAGKYGLEPNKMMATLKATAFRGEVSTEQMAALLIVADRHNLNPWLKEIYAFPSRQGIVPIVGVDGWARIINEHQQFDGMEFEQDEASCTCRMYRKDRAHPISVTEYLSECNRGTDPWKSHPKRMLRHKAMIQCARLAFSFAGIYDPDEGERVLAAEAIDVTPRNEDGKLSPKKLRAVVDGMNDAVKAENGVELHKIWKALSNDEQQFVWGELRSWERTSIKKLLDATKNQAPEDIDPWAVECLKTSTAQTLAETWRLVQDAYAERDREVPADLETMHNDRKQELGL